MNEDRFKFRAWLSSEKKMIRRLVVEIDSNPSDKPRFRRYLCQCCGSDSLHDIYDCDIIMQSTGLRDKNGVFIFEGDIVKFSVENPSVYIGPAVGKIKYSDYHAGFYIKGKMNRKIYNITIGYGYDAYPGTLLVIGNAYEHPHLLEKGND